MVLWIITAISLFCLLIRSIIAVAYKRILCDSFDMSKTRTRCIRNMKSTFEEEYYKYSGMDSISIFAQKQVYNIKTCGFRLCTWNSLCILGTVICILLGNSDIIIKYLLDYDMFGRYIKTYTGFRGFNPYIIIYGICAGIIPFSVDFVTGLKRKTDIIKLNICEYFENCMKPYLVNSAKSKPENIIQTAREIDEGMKELMDAMSCKSSDNVDVPYITKHASFNNEEEQVLNDILEEYLG